MQTQDSAGAAAAASPGAPAPDWVTISEAARRLGVNKSTVSRQVNTLGLEKNGKGEIDLAEYRRLRGEDLQPQMARQGSLADAYQSGDAAPSQGNDAAARPTKRGGLTAASTALKAIQAKTAQVALDERLNKIVYRAEVNEKLVTADRVFRDAVLGQGQRLANQLASMTDPAEIRALLDKENTAMLTMLVAEFQRLASEDQSLT